MFPEVTAAAETQMNQVPGTTGTSSRDSSKPEGMALTQAPAAIAEAQASFERFREHLAALVESGELSCWCWRVEVDASDP